MEVGKGADESWAKGGVQPQHIVEDEDLPVGMWTGTNPDGGDPYCFGDLPGYFRGDFFQDDGEAAQLFQVASVFNELLCFRLGFSLESVSTEFMDGLREQSEVSHDGDAGTQDGFNDGCDFLSAFQFDSLDARGFYRVNGIAHSLSD